MEHRACVGSLAGELDEVADVIWRRIRQQIDDERTGRGFHDRLLVRHLLDAERRREKCRAPRTRLEQERGQDRLEHPVMI
jgi:hypothetical protein